MNRICSTLASEGIEVCLVGRKKKSSLPIREKNYKQHRIFCFFETGKLFYIEYNFRLFFYLLYQQFYAVCSIDLDTVIPGILACKIKGKVHYYDAHELFPFVPEVIERPAVQKIWLWVEKFAFKHSNSIYTVGGAIAQYFEKQYHRKVNVVRNVPMSELPLLQLNHIQLPNERFILYQGALNKGRGLELLFEVIAQTQYQLVLVGDGDIANNLKLLASKLKIENQVHFLGFVLPQYLPAITKSAYIGYNVSENLGLSYYYSLNNKFFDYVSAELPSVINDFPEYTKLLTDYQVGLVAQFEIQSIKNCLDSLFQNESIYASCKLQCSLAKTEWNWENESKHLKTIYGL